MREALRELVEMTENESFTSIAVPRLATGVGGLSWDDVLPVLEERLGALAIPVYVYAEYHPDKIAHEPGLVEA